MPSNSAQVVELRVPCDPKYLLVVRLLAGGVGHRAGLTVEDIEDVKVAVSEACTNVVDHAFGEEADPAKQTMKVRLIVGNGELTVEVEDEGVGFDPKGLNRAREASLEGTGGLGFGLMRELSDAFRIESAPGSGTKVIMTKRAAG